MTSAQKEPSAFITLTGPGRTSSLYIETQKQNVSCLNRYNKYMATVQLFQQTIQIEIKTKLDYITITQHNF